MHWGCLLLPVGSCRPRAGIVRSALSLGVLRRSNSCMLRGIESLQSGRDPLDLDEEELKHLVNERLPRRYDSYRDVFGKIASDTLPGKREDIDHKIILEDGRRPEELGYNRLYKMTLEELKEYRKYITDNLQTGFIATNFAPWAAPVLFVAKVNGGQVLCGLPKAECPLEERALPPVLARGNSRPHWKG
ncbi:hypothetical protein SMAC4_14125 [Sordaria macrospora]|uniref:uncharacterized protein n=1 Tax=Sordaria macrospora TaxID=5147 RepID=UPI002B2CB233|nr:hypothetical protein SMAC4_14125 [Sordaria macrospora]